MVLLGTHDGEDGIVGDTRRENGIVSDTRRGVWYC